MIILFCSTDVITFEEYTGQVETAVTNNHSPSLNAVKHHPSGTDYARVYFPFHVTYMWLVPVMELVMLQWTECQFWYSYCRMQTHELKICCCHHEMKIMYFQVLIFMAFFAGFPITLKRVEKKKKQKKKKKEKAQNGPV